jgi:hypothetical protein
MKRLALFGLALFALACTGTRALSDAERAKLDPSLQRLLMGERVVESDYDATIRADGTKEYGLSVRSSNADELKKAGISVSSVFGDVVIVRVSLEELKTLVRLPSVRSVQNGSKDTLH